MHQEFITVTLAILEKLPLDKLIGSSFSNLFANMDTKWLRGYERATLYGETLEIVDYSPEIGKNLKIICFPTFPGHCGCILFDTDKEREISWQNQLWFSRKRILWNKNVVLPTFRTICLNKNVVSQ